MPTLVADAPSVVRAARPLERVEAEIVSLATQLTAATARLIALIGEFDAAEGWREWGMKSTAHWLSWQCGISLTTGREHVRVARALRDLPALAAAFAGGRLSYSKIRALTRFATADSDAALVEIGENATAAQIDRLRRGACRAISAADVRARHAARSLSIRVDDDGSVVGTFRLPREQGAVFLQALRAVQGRLGPRPEEEADASAEASPVRTSAADALVVLAETALQVGEQNASRTAAERFQLVVHATEETLARADDADDDGSGLLELDDGTRLHPATARRLTCACPVATVTVSPGGEVLHLGRRTRRIRGRLLRALHIRDRGACRAPGCNSRADVVHHIRHWANGGTTCLPNLISLCSQHHWLVHEGGCSLVPRAGGRWSMVTPAGVVPATAPPAPEVAPLSYDRSLRGDAVTGRWDGSRLFVNNVLDLVLPAPAPTGQDASAEASPTSHDLSRQASPSGQSASAGAWAHDLSASAGEPAHDMNASAEASPRPGGRLSSRQMREVVDSYFALIAELEREAATSAPLVIPGEHEW